jgi:hypothetical protein
MMRSERVREVLFLVPLFCIAVMACGLFRPLPHLPRLAQSRTVQDATHTAVAVGDPFPGVVLTSPPLPPTFLTVTRSPQSLLIAGGTGFISSRERFSRSPLSWVYPQVLKQDKYWDLKGVLAGHGEFAVVENYLAFDQGAAYLGTQGGPMRLLRSVGLPALYVNVEPQNLDEQQFSQARVMSAVVGDPARGEELVARYHQAMEEIKAELRPNEITHKLRVAYVGASAKTSKGVSVEMSRARGDVDTPRAGLINADDDFAAATKRGDAERLLATDPDMILLIGGENAQEFFHDSRWQGLKAVQQARVYNWIGPGLGSADPVHIVFGPAMTRWKAELGYPERLQPKLRQIFAERFRSELGYRLSEDQIDLLVGYEKNSLSRGYARFGRDAAPAHLQGLSK